MLVGCEESQVVTKAFRKNGHEAYSCDIQECSGGHPEWHIQGSVLEQLDKGWDLFIAHPPCTHISVSGAAWFEEKIKDGRQQEGIDFFMKMINAPIDKIAVENPVCIMSSVYRRADQIIQPYYFGDEFQKTTCLWLKGLKQLVHVPEGDMFDKCTHVGKGEMKEGIGKDGKKWRMAAWYDDARSKGGGKERSKTFLGIAQAMADQWGEDRLNANA